MVFNVTVKTLDSQNYQIEADNDWTIKQFKEHIEPTVNVPPNEQRLIFCGRLLKDHQKLSEYDCNGKVIHLVRGQPPSVDGSGPSAADSNNNSSGSFNDGGPNETGRFLDDNNVLFSAMTLGPENVNMNHILRHMISLQQAIIGRADGVAGATGSSMEPAAMTDMERHLHNASRLLRITVNAINECMARIAALPPIGPRRSSVEQAQSNISSLRTVITAASSHTDLPRDDSMRAGESSLSSDNNAAPEGTVDDMHVGSGNNSPTAGARRNVTRQSLTTDDLPPSGGSRPLPRTVPVIGVRTQNDSQTSSVPTSAQRGEADLDRYLSILNYSCDLQNQFQGLLRRYRQITDMSRRGGLIVPQSTSSAATSSNANPPSSSSSSAEPSAPTANQMSENDPGQPAQQSRSLSSSLMDEARILGVYVPRIMHHLSHLQHALSDFSVDFARGRLDEVEGRTRQTARRSNPPIYRLPGENASRRANERSTSESRTSNTDRAARSGDNEFHQIPTIEGSVTITATTVDATPIITTSSTGNASQTNATFVVTSEPRQAGIRIPVNIPIPVGPHGSISMDFTPIVTTRPRTQSSSSATSASGPQDNSRRFESSQTQQPRTRPQQSTTSNSTQTAPRPFGVISGRIPIPFDYFLPCFSPWATYSVANQTPSRITVRTSQQQSAPNAPPTTTTTNTNAASAGNVSGTAPQPTRNAPVGDGGLSEVVNNIFGAFFRPQQARDTATQSGTNSGPGSNQAQDPILNILPGLAVNAATQILGGVFGLPTGSSPQQTTQQAGGRQASTSSSASVMMDIDIDDSSSSQSESRYHDARDTQPPSVSAAASQPPVEPAASTRPQQSTSTAAPTPMASQSSSAPRAGTVGGRYERHIGLVQVMQNHPDWIPIIEADMSVMERNHRDAQNNQPFFSDAYLSSIPRKRRRLLTATPERVLILQPSPSEAISTLLRRAIVNSSSSNVESLDQVLSNISSDPDLQAAYEEHIKSAVETRLKSDYDYCPKKFEHSNKYFK